MIEDRINVWHIDAQDVDLELTTHVFRPLKGRVIIEMFPVQTKVGSLFLPDELVEAERPHMGVVIAAGRSLDYRKPLGIRPGDVAYVRPWDGTHIDECQFGRYQTSNQLRMFGTTCLHEGTPQLTEWWDSILAIKQKGETNMKASGRNLIIRRREFEAQPEGLLLLDHQKHRSCLAIVESVGELVQEVRVGDTVHYNPNSLKSDFRFDDEALAICEEEAINCVIVED